MNDLYQKWIMRDEREFKRIVRLEMLDEVEEFNLILQEKTRSHRGRYFKIKAIFGIIMMDLLENGGVWRKVPHQSLLTMTKAQHMKTTEL